MDIECLNCKTKFHISPSRMGIRKYCSAQCREEYEKGLSMTAICAHCNKEFKVYKHELPRKKYCSKECSNQAKIKTVEFTCDYCGKTFIKVPSRPQGEKIYCSNECKSKASIRRETRPCTVCGKPVTRPPSLFKTSVLCSKECESEFRSEMATGMNSPVFNSTMMKCLVCGKEYFESKSRVEIGKGKFCSKECKYQYMSEHYSEMMSPEWEGGAKLFRGQNWKEQRIKALERDDYTCVKCGSTEQLLVHHKIPYADFNGDYLKANELSNLETLCLSCHSSLKSKKMPC